MPIEIKELYIKINVNDSAQSNAAPDKQPGAKEQNVVEMCLEQISQWEQRKKER
ncbi:MAG TPA: DUF5908 family protein [Flavobacteriaceae bacterium]|nr:hypothetical protein [Flavobacteriaceae bacterium]MCB9213516.1 hypothetical protein [Alteromonas sp.]HPF10742.1 DUF5908 family protein [Flavobacteriaceae bacterium]HQU21550.1 DUF5908 family protein [Flavobacteriaceae bacterium]HQU65519.1 DUF5908 family protein [Flavobacteriaceae bacterium]